MTFPTGYRETAFGAQYAYASHRVLLGRPRELRWVGGDLTPLRGPRICQRDEGECTGAGVRRAGQLYYALRGVGALEWSDQALYTLGRLQEWRGTNPDTAPALEDWGADPAWVLEAANKVGIITALQWPGPGDVGHDRSKRNVEPPPELLVTAWRWRGLRFHRVEWRAGQLQQEVEALHRGGFPVMAAFCADGIQDNPGTEIVDWLPPASRANHWVTCLDSGTGSSHGRWDNWWDDPSREISWGDPDPSPRYRGTWNLAWAAAEMGLALVLALDFAPEVQE